MKLIRGNRNRWSMAFSLMFAVQVVAYAFCVTTPAMAAGQQLHNHTAKVSMDVLSEASEMPMPASACINCDISTTFLKSSVSLDDNQHSVLLALIVLPLSMNIEQRVQPQLTVGAHAPPRSSLPLYQTTQRILI